jgi:hypothetical protein
MTRTRISRVTKPARKPLPGRSRSAKAAGLTSSDARLKRILAAMLAFRDGNFAVRPPSDWEGVEGQIAAVYIQTISHEDELKREVARLRRAIGHEGRLKERISVPGVTGGWAAKVDYFNGTRDDLARPSAEISRVIGDRCPRATLDSR